ncbi:MAG: DNA repair protein RadA [Deltaproteobacteria bacterium]|nr:DNA repair protein RadA [Candidatus Zymogenaceae bacterium]
MSQKKKKDRVVYVCSECGHTSPQWMGRCPGCDRWNTLSEEVIRAAGRKTESKREAPPTPLFLSDAVDVGTRRLSTGISELDRVLGGGLVEGSVVLVGGDPGVGKTTLLMQALSHVSQSGVDCLYVSGEESLAQLKLRGERLGLDLTSFPVLFSANTDEILSVIEDFSPRFVVLDSIQTAHFPELDASPGSISQLRAVSAAIISTAKERNTAVILVGHITKEGTIAGPKVLEHLVDTVLYFEGDSGGPYRLLKAHKNRFGPTFEVGVFEMGDRGLLEVTNPSELFLSQRVVTDPGSAVTASLEGTRTLLVEVQSLVVKSLLAVPRRVTVGMDQNRVHIIAAVLERTAGVSLSQHDIFINVVGGLRLTEPAADLALAATLISSFLNIPMPSDTVLFGEIGLSGEVRGVSQSRARIAEAAKLGFKRVVMSKASLSGASGGKDIACVGISSVGEVMEVVFQAGTA